jgi:hypothetical protein
MERTASAHMAGVCGGDIAALWKLPIKESIVDFSDLPLIEKKHSGFREHALETLKPSHIGQVLEYSERPPRNCFPSFTR